MDSKRHEKGDTAAHSSMLERIKTGAEAHYRRQLTAPAAAPRDQGDCIVAAPAPSGAR